MWISGYVVAPILFTLLDRKLAGEVAGQIFQVSSYIAITCLLILLIIKTLSSGKEVKQDWQCWVLLTALAITLFGEFYLAEAMREIKNLYPQLAKGMPGYSQFANLHRISGVLFLLNSLLGLVLVVKYKFVPLQDQGEDRS